jgi:hypothetical protein
MLILDKARALDLIVARSERVTIPAPFMPGEHASVPHHLTQEHQDTSDAVHTFQWRRLDLLSTPA